MANMKIKKGDLVRVITGKDKGKEGKVLVVDPKTNRAIVEGVNIAVKNTKAGNGQQGGQVKKENPIHVSNIMYLYNGKPTRIGISKEVVEKNGQKKTVTHRLAKNQGNAVID